MALGGFVFFGQKIAKAKHYDKLAAELETAKEALDVAGMVAQDVAQGKSLVSAVEGIEASEEAMNLVRKFKLFAHLGCLVLVCCLMGCTAAQLASDEAALKSDFHTASSLALGAVTAAINDPATLAEAKSLLQTAVSKAAPKDVPALQAALAHVNSGALQDAASVLQPLVSASAPGAP
jgi:hypothetical protein